MNDAVAKAAAFLGEQRIKMDALITLKSETWKKYSDASDACYLQSKVVTEAEQNLIAVARGDSA